MSRMSPPLRPFFLLRFLAVAAVLVLTMTGCGGIPTDSRPQALDESLLSDELASSGAEATRVAVQFDPKAFPIYLVGEGSDGQERLVSVFRELSVTASAEQVINALLEGPTDEEVEQGLSSALPSELQVLNVEGPQSGTVVIDVASGTFTRLPSAEQRLGIAQLVFTVTDLNQTSSIRLQVDGVNSPVPKDGEDSTSEEPVGRVDYNSVAPEES